MKQPVSSLRQWMLEQYAPQFHLEKKTLLKQLDQVGFYAERCLPPVGQRVSCQRGGWRFYMRRSARKCSRRRGIAR